MGRLERREKRMLREMEREESVQRQSKGSQTKIIISVLVLALLGGAGFLLAAPRTGSPALSLETVYYDFGQVSQRAGVVTADIPIQNKGDGDLIIAAMSSSCMCTSASLIVNGDEGPRYGMHRIEGGGFASSPIPSGGEGIVRIRYDPNVHATFRGPATRVITMQTNDPANPSVSVRADLYQVD